MFRYFFITLGTSHKLDIEMILLIGAEKGGVGKSSIAVNIATIAAINGVEVLILDTDSTGSATTWCRIRGEENVAPAVPLLTLTTNPIATLPDLARKYELIIVDVGARSYSTLLQVAILSDLVIVPTTPGQYEAESTSNLFESLRSLDAKHRKGKVPAFALLNKLPTNAQSREEGELRSYLTSFNIPIMKTCLRDRKAWRDSSKSGRAVCELKGADSSPKGTAELNAVYKEAESLASQVG